MQIQDGAVVLFQGDSITDAGRSRENDALLGSGYASMLAAQIGARFPEHQIRFLNRGISGNRAADLELRWQKDCIDLKPDWVSIMIGINDTWRAFDRNDPTSTADYAASYRRILEQVRDQLDARLILIEPFVLPHPEDRKRWRDDLNPRIDAVRILAQEFGAVLVPMDGIFAAACCRREPAFWAADGVHPSPAGHALIARSWLSAVGVCC
jgi:lysophospholipase L1-like esterase